MEAQLVIVLLLAGRVKAMGGHVAVPRVADDGGMLLVPAVKDPVRDETAVPLRPPPARGDVKVTRDLLHISRNSTTHDDTLWGRRERRVQNLVECGQRWRTSCRSLSLLFMSATSRKTGGLSPPSPVVCCVASMYSSPCTRTFRA